MLLSCVLPFIVRNCSMHACVFSLIVAVDPRRLSPHRFPLPPYQPLSLELSLLRYGGDCDCAYFLFRPCPVALVWTSLVLIEFARVIVFNSVTLLKEILTLFFSIVTIFLQNRYVSILLRSHPAISTIDDKVSSSETKSK